jgi:hypothetical protein
MDWTPKMAAALLFVAARRERKYRLLAALAGRTKTETLQRELRKLEE